VFLKITNIVLTLTAPSTMGSDSEEVDFYGEGWMDSDEYYVVENKLLSEHIKKQAGTLATMQRECKMKDNQIEKLSQEVSGEIQHHFGPISYLNVGISSEIYSPKK
jgi:hypothetical protein